MRKILLGLIIAVLTIFTVNVVYQGNSFGSLEVWGAKQISEKNDDIDDKNSKLANLTKISFPETLSKLSQSSETLQQTKKQYEEKAILLSKNKYYRQTEKYKHEFLLTKIGNYAKDNNIDVKIVVTNSHTPGLYDINFKISGKYTDVANYIYDIENDSKLGFKIEDFSMTAGGTATVTKEDGTTESVSGVSASFNCKEISIDLKGVQQDSTQQNNNTDASQNNATSNTENNTNTTAENTTVNNNNNTPNSNAQTNTTQSSNAANTNETSGDNTTNDNPTVDQAANT